MKAQIITTFLIFTLIGCTTSEPQLLSVDNIYQIELPSDMSPMTTEINMVASLQYANLFKEKYIMIIHEEKSEVNEAFQYSIDLQKFTKIVVQGYEESFNCVANISDISIDGFNGNMVKMDGELDGINITWHAILIESKSYFYQICFWTLTNRKKKHMEGLFNSAKTFHEL